MGGKCSDQDQPVPFKDALPGWVDDSGQRLKEVFGLSPVGEDEEVDGEEKETGSINIQDLINNDRCQPKYPFNLCYHN